MGLRIVLVSMVAGLGMTLPTRDDVKQWSHSAELWMNARLAEWDSGMPNDQRAFALTSIEPSRKPAEAETSWIVENVDAGLSDTIGDCFSTEGEALTRHARRPSLDRPAAVAIVANTPAPQVKPEPKSKVAISFEPMIAPADLYEGLAFAINRAADGLSTPTPALSATTPPSTSLANIQPTRFGPLPRTRAGLIQPVEIVTAVEPPPAREASPKVVATEPQVNFEQDLASSEPADDTAALDCGATFVMSWNEEPATTPSGEVTVSSTSARDSSVSNPAPAVPTDRGETRREANPPVLETDRDLGRAVRLTREAVHAWANLFHGPAIVTLAR
ncbi:MAG: hypothetical protein KGM43_08635 [Planctomycetota bacterium]|nr:hypothetical protein [Planctomycetota bacterium]